MTESLPPACAHCQGLLSLGPDAFHQPGVRDHLAGCATCSQLYAQYCEIDRLLNQFPDQKPLPDLALRFQQIPQARHIAELDERFATWEGLVEEKSSIPLLKQWPGEADTSPLDQGKKTMQKQPITSTTKPANDLNNGQFQSPLNSTQRQRRPFWRMIATAVAVLLAVVTIGAWVLLPHLNQPPAVAGHGRSTPTSVPATSTVTGPSQSFTTYTAQDSGKTVTYSSTDRFSIGLNQDQYPRQNLQLACNPQGAIGSITNVPYAAPPLYAVAYQANEAGTCTITDRNFVLTVIVSGGVQTPTPVPSPTAVPPTPTSTSGFTQQYAFTAQDSGRTVTYGITTRFSLSLNQDQYPQQNLQLACNPQGALGSVTNVPYAAPPLYAVAYQANEAGTCTLKDGSFILTVVITQ